MRRAAVPPQLDGLTHERLLGSGGFSDVFLYEQKFPRRKVAVKVLTAEDLSAAVSSAFIAEANLMAQLSAHPFIVSIFGADIAPDGRPYFVMEFCSGPSMAERYKRKPLSVEDALRTGVRIAGAVATAHHAGVLHRDIKPANILTNDFGWPALTDFGISSAVEGELPVHTVSITRDRLPGGGSSTTGGTGSNATVGMSIPWSPPEMFADEPMPDVRSDVFSLAATIFTLLAGRTPFEVAGRPNGALDLIGRIERGVVAPMGRADVPRSLVAVLAKAMATNREERYATAIDFGRALQRVETELGFTPTALDVPRVVEPEDPDADAEGGEETEIRRVVTIDAQPAAPAAQPAGAIEPPGWGAAVEADRTVVRGAPTVVEQPANLDATVVRRPVAAPQPAEAPALALEPAAPPAKRSRVGVIVGSIAAVLVAAAVVIAVIVGPGAAPQPTVTDPPDDPSAVGGSILAPTVSEGKFTKAGDAARFWVTNPDPQERDAVRWALVSDPDVPNVVRDAGETTEITVPDVDADTQVCILVQIQRAGRTSAETRACTTG